VRSREAHTGHPCCTPDALSYALVYGPQPCFALTIPRSDITAASLLFRIGAIPPENSDWARPGDSSFVDWDRVIAVALLENSITVLNDRVSTLPDSILPSSTRARIARLSLVWTFKLQLLEKRLAESVGALATAGIDVVVMKGAALALTVYPKFTDRPMADLDLLVDSRKAEQAHQILQTSGWTVASIPRPADAWCDHHHLRPLVDTAGTCLRLELHTAPLVSSSPYRLTGSDFVASARRIDLHGTPVFVPDAHLHAVHAAIHFAYSHGFASGGLNVFRDVVMLRRNGALSWDGFLEAAIRTRSESCCYWTLRLARALSGLSVPETVLGALSPRLGDRISAMLEEHFSQLVLRADHACPSVELRQRLWEFGLQIERSHIGSASILEHSPNPDLSPHGTSAWRRVGAHFRRAPKWSRYVASLLGPAFELTR